MQVFPATLPVADKARSQFHSAVRHGEPDAAEAAIIVLARSEGVHQLFELMAPYAYRGGGVHWWIFLSNSWARLESIGWHYAEPVLRSMARQFSHDSRDDEESFEHWYRTVRQDPYRPRPAPPWLGGPYRRSRCHPRLARLHATAAAG